MRVPKDSPLRNPIQIPFLDPSPVVQNLPDAVDEEDTPSMRELVRAIDSHVLSVDLEVTSNPRADDQLDENVLHPPSTQLTENVVEKPSKEVAGQQHIDP